MTRLDLGTDGVMFDSGITDFVSGPSSPAPEPATPVLLAMGLSAIAVVRRRRRAPFER